MVRTTHACLLFAAGLLLLAVPHQRPGWAQAPSSLTREAASFDRSVLVRPGDAKKIRDGGTLGGGKGDWGITGSLDYDFDIARAGWYELILDGPGDGVTFILDPRGNEAAVVVEGARAENAKPPKAGNLYLTAGRHTLRIQRYFWTGFPLLRGFSLSPSPPLLATSMRAAFASPGTVFGTAQCPPIEIIAGGGAGPAKLTVWTKDQRGKVYRTDKVDLPALAEPRTFRLPAYCDEPGRFIVEFSDGKTISWRDVPALIYTAVDTKSPTAPASPGQPVLVSEIDASSTDPHYSAGGATRVVSGAHGRYRESGDVGFTLFQRAPGPLRAALPEPSWFAYRLAGLVPQSPHMVEIEYPDDRSRTQVFALREPMPLAMIAGGVDTGGEFSLTGRMLAHQLVFWPKSTDVRLVVLNVHNGRKAAIGRIRVYRLEGALSAAGSLPPRGRQIVNWYEEGSNFIGLYGAQSESPESAVSAVARWAEAVAGTGGTTLMPTVAVYSFGLYPSRFHRAFSRPDTDLLRTILLNAEQRKLKVIADLHPRADELDWPFAGSADPKPNLLVSREGRSNYFQADGKSRNYPPLYNPLHPSNQDWYVNMIGELADNYRDSPALAGVSLRLMQWANPALNNFHSGDWGYDDHTVGLFVRETGISVPVPGESPPGDLAANAKARYAWLMANAKQRWIQWRCEKIARLYTRVRDRIRLARPDLKVYSPVFFWEPGGDLESLRAAGIDPALLGGIDGVTLIDARARYGRRESDPITVQRKRDSLIDPLRLAELSAPRASGAFLATAEYVETTEVVAPPDKLGFPPGTRAIWNSAAVNPSGRHVLERYALELAETDAQIVGEGGNGYSLPQPVLRDFLAEYRKLPAERFTARADARDPVAVWELSGDSRFFFYAVNRERYPVDVQIRLAKDTPVERLSTGRRQLPDKGILRLRLLPYQLIGFAAAADQTIREVSVTPPAREIARLRTQVAWLRKLDAEIRDALLSRLSKEDRTVLHSHALAAHAALESGSYRRSRTLIENHRLLQIYRSLDKHPPDLVDALIEPD